MVDHVEVITDRPTASPTVVGLHRLASRLSWISHEALLFPVAALYLGTLAGSLPREVLSDSWLAILGGYEVAHHGLPTHDALTIWLNGREWVDQQWLAQLAFYGLYALGGLKLALFGHVAAAGSAFVLALVAARHRGGSTRSICWIALPVIFLLIWGSWNARAQSFAFVLFVAVVWLVIRDGRSPSRQVFLALPLIALWANIHGSVLTGALIVALAGVTHAWGRKHEPTLQWLPRASALVLAPIACVFASPYATDLPSYYARVLGHPGFRDFIVEWAPTSPSIRTAPFYLLAFLTVWLIGRYGDRLILIEKVVLAVTLLLGLQTLRSVIWFAFAVLIIVPVALDGALKPTAAAMRFRRLNHTLVAVSIVGTLVALSAVAAQPASWFAQDYPSQAIAIVDRIGAASPEARIFANEAYADWLLLERPALRGRIAYDARLELASKGQIERLVDVRRTVEGWRKVVAPFDVFVLNKEDEGVFARALAREPGAHVEYRAHGLIVISRPSRTNEH